jgi:hypothetical protein
MLTAEIIRDAVKALEDAPIRPLRIVLPRMDITRDEAVWVLHVYGVSEFYEPEDIMRMCAVAD